MLRCCVRDAFGMSSLTEMFPVDCACRNGVLVTLLLGSSVTQILWPMTKVGENSGRGKRDGINATCLWQHRQSEEVAQPEESGVR